MKDIAGELKELREKAGLTLAEVLRGYPDWRVREDDLDGMERGQIAFPPALMAHIRRLARERGVRPPALIADKIPVGRHNAIKRYELRLAAHMGDRRMRKAIEADRKNGYRICNGQDGDGYYIAGSDAEAEHFAASQRARAREILRSVDW